MPRYRVCTVIIDPFTAVYEAENEQAARDLAYDEIRNEIPDRGYVEQSSEPVTDPA